MICFVAIESSGAIARGAVDWSLWTVNSFSFFYFLCGASWNRTMIFPSSTGRNRTISANAPQADEKRIELLLFRLTTGCFTVKLFVLVGPVRLELTASGVKDRHSTNWVTNHCCDDGRIRTSNPYRIRIELYRWATSPFILLAQEDSNLHLHVRSVVFFRWTISQVVFAARTLFFLFTAGCFTR